MDADQFDRVIRRLAEGFPRRRIGRILAAIATANGIGWSGSTRPRLGGATPPPTAQAAATAAEAEPGLLLRTELVHDGLLCRYLPRHGFRVSVPGHSRVGQALLRSEGV